MTPPPRPDARQPRSPGPGGTGAGAGTAADLLGAAAADSPELVGGLAGTVDGPTLAGVLDRWCRDHLGSGVAGVTWAHASMGLAVGVDLVDGRALVVKARPADQTARVAESRTLQGALAAAGLPVPAPVGSLHPFGPGVAGAEVRVDGATPIARTEVATLARLHHDLVRAATRLCPSGLVLHEPWGIALPPDQLWPEPPHDPRFDLTLPGADAIDAAGRAFRQRLAAARDRPRLVGHVDWRAEHVLVADDAAGEDDRHPAAGHAGVAQGGARGDGAADAGGARGDGIGDDDGHGGVVAVLDWDALVRAPEPVLVGQAAAGCTIVWGRPDPHPTIAEARAFVAAYEAARGAPFDPDERDLLDAAHGYVVAYGARCEHSDDHTGRGAPGVDGWRRLLAARADADLRTP